MDIETVGVIGLGRMGLGMATTLVRNGFKVIGHDIDEARRPLAMAGGIECGSSLTAVLHAAEVLVVSLPNAQDVAAVVTAADGLLTRRDCQVVVIDTSTSDPATTRALAARLAAAGHGLLDAPVSGGPSGAADGTLSMMVGGTAANYARALPILSILSSRAMHVGPSGAGNIAKLVNNLLVAVHLIAAGEAMRLAQAAGLPPTEAIAVINSATGRSTISEVIVPRWVLPGTFDSGFSAGLMRKDLRLALELAEDTGSVLPLAAQVGRLWVASQGAVPDTADFTRMADYRDRGATP